MSGTDSAGVPWQGREFRPNESAHDDGAADPRLIEALRRFRVGDLEFGDVLDALGTARLLVPLMTHRGDVGVAADGHLVDKTQELALVTVAGPDARPVLPAFTSVETMRSWNPLARPIPVAAARAALAAASDALAAIVLDPGSPTEFAVRRTAFEAVALGHHHIPPFADDAVLAAFRSASSGEPVVRSLKLVSGDPDARLAAPEVLVELTLAPGLDRAALDAVLVRLGEAWAASPVIVDRVDSIGVRVESVS